MKKIFMIFAVCFITLHNASFGLDEYPIHNLSLDANGYAKKGRCEATTSCNTNNEYIHFGSSMCYEADNSGDGCRDGLIACILGQSEIKEGIGKILYNGCWKADTGGVMYDDEWLVVKNTSDADFKIPDCHTVIGAPWTPNGSGKKTVFVTRNTTLCKDNPKGCIIVDTSKKRASSIIFENTTYLNNLKLCVGYICTNNTNNGYGNPNGSCDTTPPAPDPVDPSPAPGPDPAPTPTPTNDGPHKNTVQPYLDALNAKCKK